MAKFEDAVKIHELKRGDVFYETGLGQWAKFIALEDGGEKTTTDGIGQEFTMNSVVVKILDTSFSDRSRINSIIKIEDDSTLERNRGPRIYRTKIDDENDIKKDAPLQGDWKHIGK